MYLRWYSSCVMHFFMQCIFTYTWCTHTHTHNSPAKKKTIAHFSSLWHHGRPRHEDRCRARGWHPFSSIESGGLMTIWRALLRGKSFSWETNFILFLTWYLQASQVLLKFFHPWFSGKKGPLTVNHHNAPLHDLRCTIQHLSQPEVLVAGYQAPALS